MLKRILSLLGACFLSLIVLRVTLLAGPSARAAPQVISYVVDRTDDPNPAGLACTGAANDCSLRAAIITANANPGSNVFLSPGTTYSLTRAPSGGNDATSGDLNISADMTVVRFCFTPPCGGTAVAGGVGWADRIFHIEGDARVTLGGLTIRDGHVLSANGGGIYVTPGSTLTLTGSTVMGNVAENHGGGIYNNGTLVVTHSVVANNSAGTPGGGDAGGGIYNNDVLLLTNSTVASNTASHSGGGIASEGTLVLNNSAVVSNTANVSDGGGIKNEGRMTMTAGTVMNNVAGHAGGGLANELGSGAHMNIIRSSVLSNTAAYGGGIANSEFLTITNSTVSGNRADQDGGGVELDIFVPLARFDSVTFVNNVADADDDGSGDGGGVEQSGDLLLMGNTLLAGNVDRGGQAPDCSGTLTSQGYNLIENMAGCVITGTLTGNVLGADPLLGPPQDNGGSMLTHALLPGSPAIDAGSPAACPVTDQRGVPRPYDGNGLGVARCDVGAYEYDGPPVRRMYLPLVIK